MAEKLTLKQKLTKSLGIKQKNLKKKLASVTDSYQQEKKEILEALEIVELQLKALLK